MHQCHQHKPANNKTPPRWPTLPHLASEFCKRTSSPKLNRHSIEQHSDQKSASPTCLEPGYIVLPLNEVARSRIERTRRGGGGEKVAPVFSLLCKAGLSVVDPWNEEADAARGVKRGWKSGSGGCRIAWACTHLHHVSSAILPGF